MTEHDEHTLVERAKEGDEKAFESLVQVKLNWVQSWCFAESMQNKVASFSMNKNVEVSEFIKRCAELCSGIRWNQLGKLNDAPACFKRIHSSFIRRCITVAGGVAIATGSVVDRPRNDIAIQR